MNMFYLIWEIDIAIPDLKECTREANSSTAQGLTLKALNFFY